MKRKLTTICTLLLVGIATAWADTSVITSGTDGWTKITSIPSNVGDYYFVFVDNSQDLMLSFGEGPNQSTNAAYKTMVYRTSENPAMNPAMLWTLEANGSTWGVRSVAVPSYLMQTEYNWDGKYATPWYWRTHDVSTGNEWSTLALEYSNGSWTLQSTHYTDKNYYIGPWNDAAFSNGQEVAGNKTNSADIGHFQIYSILKSAVDWEHNALKTRPANYSYKIANAYAAFNGVTGWTGTGSINRKENEGFDGVAGFFEFCDWNAKSWSGSLSQTITGLPSGKYRIRVAGQQSATDVVTTLDANGTSVNLPANGDSGGNILQTGKETNDGNGVNGWKYASVETNVTSGSLTITLTSTASAQYRWANVDNVELYYLGPLGISDLEAGDECTSLFITNPGFEDNADRVDLSSSNLTGVTGWTLVSADNTNDVGTRAYGNEGSTFYSYNGVGDYCFNSYWEGKPLTQEIGLLPAGTYELSALVTTGNGSSTGTVYLNAGSAHSTGYARKSANTNFYHREKLVFTLSSAQNVTIGIRGGSDPAEGAAKGAWNENGYWWYKCDDFQLKYVCKPTQANLYSQLQTLVTNCAPWTSGDEYATRYATYAAYTASNSVAELTTAIDYLNNEYEKYALAYGSNSHPYDLKVVQNPSYDNGQASWSEAHNNTGTYSQGIASDGTQTNFYQVSTNTYLRHASIYQEGIVLDEGLYRLSAKMKGTPKDNESTYIYATTGTVDHWGNPVFAGTTYYGYLTTDVASSWSTVEAYVTLDAPAKLRVGALSWGNNWSGGNGGAFSVDDWKLEKIDYAVTTKSGVTTAVGPAPLATINAALTSDVAALNLQKATGLSSAAISTTNNPNLLVFANSGQVSNTNNVVVDGTCSNLVLVDGHPFINPSSFTATNASYTLSALAGNEFATLMIPFAASTLAGTAYTLNQGVDLIDGNIRGTATSEIAANSPVIVTTAGNYTGSSVTVPVVAAGATYTSGELVGTYTALTAPQGSYVLQNHTSSEGVAFYLVGTTRPTVNPFRAYIKSQGSNARAIKVIFDETQGISDAMRLNDKGEMINDKESGKCFDLQGRQIVNGKSVNRQLSKGLYIVNGKKVLVK